MIRFAWLQARTQTLVAAALLAALAVAAAVTGVQLSHLYTSLVAHCTASCGLATSRFLSHDIAMEHALDIIARAIPAVLGIFWGAPLLAREFESGTYRLAWTQSVPRARWLITKLALGGFATAALAGLLTLTITWWYRAEDRVGTNAYAVFDRRDIAPVAYALFAFALGALLGAVLRRTVAAMAATLAGFVLLRVATSLWVRPYLLPPVHVTRSLFTAGPSGPVQLGIGSSNGGPIQLFFQTAGPADAWTLSSQLVTASGQPVSSARISAFLRSRCPHVGLPPAGPPPVNPRPQRAGPAADAARACLHAVAKTFHAEVTYQPASRYWTFQWLETAIFVVLALASAVACYRWVVTRRAT